MRIRLKDIIDLDYFIYMDDAIDSPEDIQSQTVRDRKIYNQCKSTAQTETTLLLEWLSFRKDKFFREKDKKGLTQLPGTIFSTLYSWMVYAMALSGGITGISLAYSLLAYHGNRPINVTIFIVLFVVLQAVLILFTLILMVQRSIGTKKRYNFFHNSIIHTLITSLFFKLVPKILKKTGQPVYKKSYNTLEYATSLIRVKKREYKDLFFWPIFSLTSVFAFCFSAGALGGTFFRVIVSDMAFGWQSTLMTSSERVYDLVSFIALPWSWFVPESFTHPTLEQIEGSRIILKDGISVLATQDLVSWWPFICMGILFYAVIPRGFLLIAGILAQKNVLQQFNFKRPGFKQLIVRMQSPVMDIDVNKIQERQSIEKGTAKGIEKRSSLNPGTDMTGQKALLIFSKNVYSDKIIKRVINGIEKHLFFNVKEAMGISFDFENDEGAFRRMCQGDIDHVILVHEVWQPPIRGLLHYITQLKAIMLQHTPLWILLTRDPGEEDLCVDNNDINYDVWKKAVFKLEDPYISVKRFILS